MLSLIHIYGGALTLAGAPAEGGNPAQAAYKGITVNGGTLNIGSADAPKTPVSYTHLAASDAIFTGAIYGGGYGTAGTSTVKGNSRLTLDGGAYTGALYAGGGGARSAAVSYTHLWLHRR